jgi:hypothetical protein
MIPSMRMPANLDTRGSAIDPWKTQRIVDHVLVKWKLERCRLCDGTEFAVFAQNTLRFYGDPSMIAGPSGSHRPTAAITCTSCGHAMLLDLLIAGVYRSKDDPGPAPTGPYR